MIMYVHMHIYMYIYVYIQIYYTCIYIYIHGISLSLFLSFFFAREPYHNRALFEPKNCNWSSLRIVSIHIHSIHIYMYTYNYLFVYTYMHIHLLINVAQDRYFLEKNLPPFFAAFACVCACQQEGEEGGGGHQQQFSQFQFCTYYTHYTAVGGSVFIGVRLSWDLGWSVILGLTNTRACGNRVYRRTHTHIHTYRQTHTHITIRSFFCFEDMKSSNESAWPVWDSDEGGSERRVRRKCVNGWVAGKCSFGTSGRQNRRLSN